MFLLKNIHMAKERYSTFMVFYALSNFPHFHSGVYLLKVGLFIFLWHCICLALHTLHSSRKVTGKQRLSHEDAVKEGRMIQQAEL